MAKLDLYQRMVDRIGQSPAYVGRRHVVHADDRQPGHGEVPGRHGATTAEDATLAYNSVGPGLLPDDGDGHPRRPGVREGERSYEVCVLNQSAAQLLFPGQGPWAATCGRRRTWPRPWRRPSAGQSVTCRVVGVAPDAKFASLREAPPRTIYFPVTADVADGNLVFLLNGPTKAGVIAAYRDALREIAPTIPLVLFATLREQMDARWGASAPSPSSARSSRRGPAPQRHRPLRHAVVERHAAHGEIGIRAALGASRGVILRMVFADALRAAGMGVAMGTLALFFARAPIHHLLYGAPASTSPRSPPRPCSWPLSSSRPACGRPAARRPSIPCAPSAPSRRCASSRRGGAVIAPADATRTRDAGERSHDLIPALDGRGACLPHAALTLPLPIARRHRTR